MSTEKTDETLPNNVYYLPPNPSPKPHQPEKVFFLQVIEFINLAKKYRYAIDTLLRNDCHGLVVDIRQGDSTEPRCLLIENKLLGLSRASLTWISLYLRKYSGDPQLIEVIKSKLEFRKLDPETDLNEGNLTEFKKLIEACYDFEAIWQRYKQVQYQNLEYQNHTTKYEDLETIEEINAEINHLLNTLFSLVGRNLRNMDFFTEFKQIKKRFVEKLAEKKIQTQKPKHLTVVTN